MAKLRVALVHDYLKDYGGAEKVLTVLHEMFPQAPIYTAFCLPGSSAARAFPKATIKQSWFGHLPSADKFISPLRFLLPLIWAGFNFKGYDLVVSSASWAITKGFARGKTKELCYCHTPPRFLYGYDTSRDWRKHWYLRAYAVVVNHYLRLYDFLRAQKVTQFVANSQETQRRIKKFYRRDSTVIYPPVEVPRTLPKASKENFFLTGGRLERPKNFDVIIRVCTELNLPLKVFGAGTQELNLRRLAGDNVEFLGFVTDEQKKALMARAQAFIVAARDEDSGITPVEAMAQGTAVIAYRGGGYLETIVPGKTGEFFQSEEELKLSLKKFTSRKYSSQSCWNQARQFNREKFREKIEAIVKLNSL